MKLKDGFALREVAEQIVVMPMGDGLDMNRMITLNDTGRFIWEALQKETSVDAIVAALLKEYDVAEDRARANVEAFVARLKELDFLA